MPIWEVYSNALYLKALCVKAELKTKKQKDKQNG